MRAEREGRVRRFGASRSPSCMGSWMEFQIERIQSVGNWKRTGSLGVGMVEAAKVELGVSKAPPLVGQLERVAVREMKELGRAGGEVRREELCG